MPSEEAYHPSVVTPLMKLVHEVFVNDYEVPPRTLAKRIGRTYPTLMRELNPFDPKAKLGVDTLYALMFASRDTRVLEFMANGLGFTLTPIPAKEQTTIQKELAHIVQPDSTVNETWMQ